MISKELKQYYIDNKPTIDYWIKANDKLQPGMDFLQPIIKEFKADKANEGINLNGCHECIIDMLRWLRKEAKDETKEENPKK